MKIPKSIPKKNRGGDCYEVSAKYVLDSQFHGKNAIPEEVLKQMEEAGISAPSQDVFLVHGEVEGQGAISGVKYGHAWVEEGDMVIDKSNGRDIQIPKTLYYVLGRIERVIKYNVEQTRKMVMQYGHWGPWELKTDL